MSFSEITQATQKVAKASDFRDDTKLLMQPYANWEEYLTPAPISIAIMGELVFISSKVDFSINKNPPKDGFKYLKYPESFRACLMQVCNASWGAFNEAHKNMDQIRLHTVNVPKHIMTSVQILLQEDQELVRTLLPDSLESIDNISKDCLQLAERTEGKFTFVIQLIQEVLEACINAKHGYDEELENIKKKIEETKLREAASKEANERAEKAFKNMEEQLKDVQQSFNKSLDDLPSGWEVIGMNFVEGLSNSFNSVLSGSLFLFGTTGQVMSGIKIGTEAVTKITTSIIDAVNVTNTGTQAVNTYSQDNIFSAINILSKSEQLLVLTRVFGNYVHEGQIKCSDIYDQKSKTAKTDHLQKMFENVRDSINKENECEIKQRALKICEKGICICSDLATIGLEGKCDDSQMIQLVENIQDVIQLAQQFDSKSKSEMNSTPLSVKPPQLAQTQNSSSGSQSASQIATESARLRIEQSRAQLDKVREMYEKSVDNMEKNKKELTEILITMRSYVIKEIDFNTTIEILVKGLDAMGKVKEQWEKMVRFFQMVSNIIKTCLSTSLDRFVKTVDKASTAALTYTSKMFIKDMIYNQAMYAFNIASLVHMISSTYTEVSAKYLMDRVSSLGRLMALDPSKHEFDSERMSLQNACEEAQDGITSLVQKNKRDFENKTKARLEAIEKELKAVLPPQTEAEEQKLRKIVVAEFKSPAEDQLNQFV